MSQIYGTAESLSWSRNCLHCMEPKNVLIDPGSVHVGFVVGKVALGQVFPCQVHSTSAPLHRRKKKLTIFITGLHSKPQGCGATVASAAGPFTTNKNVLMLQIFLMPPSLSFISTLSQMNLLRLHVLNDKGVTVHRNVGNYSLCTASHPRSHHYQRCEDLKSHRRIQSTHSQGIILNTVNIYPPIPASSNCLPHSS
jgi:hypothetical protein